MLQKKLHTSQKTHMQKYDFFIVMNGEMEFHLISIHINSCGKVIVVGMPCRLIKCLPFLIIGKTSMTIVDTEASGSWI